MTLADVYAQMRSECAAAGGQRAWSNKHGISEQYVSDVMNARHDPGEKILTALGLRRVVTFERIKA